MRSWLLCSPPVYMTAATGRVSRFLALSSACFDSLPEGTWSQPHHVMNLSQPEHFASGSQTKAPAEKACKTQAWFLLVRVLAHGCRHTRLADARVGARCRHTQQQTRRHDGRSTLDKHLHLRYSLHTRTLHRWGSSTAGSQTAPDGNKTLSPRWPTNCRNICRAWPPAINLSSNMHTPVMAQGAHAARWMT